jgi:hypothetical protein
MKINNMKKTSKLFGVVLMVTLFLSSCSPTEKKVKADNTNISGFINKYLKVVNGEYQFTNNGDDAFITVQFELKEKPEMKICRKKHPESVRLNPIDDSGNIFDTGSYGFSPSRTEMSKIKDLLNNGEKNGKIRVSFKWDYYGVSKKEGKPIFKKATSFEIIDNTFNYCSKTSNDDLHWDDGFVRSNETVKSKGSLSKKGSVKWDKTLDSYDEYVNQYVKLIKKINQGDTSIMTEYAEMMEKANDFSNKLNNAGNDLSTSQMTRFMKIQTKLASAIE